MIAPRSVPDDPSTSMNPVSGPDPATGMSRIVPTASPSRMSAPVALLSTSVNRSPSSATVSARIGTDTACSVAPGVNVSVPSVRE
ncbi:MAG: hypothetical protein OXG72_08540 [Acidobacteria bacterium]|nr:hypothetical protein [Acidobacteriota bacterium]